MHTPTHTKDEDRKKCFVVTSLSLYLGGPPHLRAKNSLWTRHMTETYIQYMTQKWEKHVHCIHVSNNNLIFYYLYILVGLLFISASFCVSLVDFISSCCIFCCTVSVPQLYHQSARAAQCIQPLSNHCFPAATTASGHPVMKKAWQ